MSRDDRRAVDGRGQSMVEFALVAPMFLLAIFGIIEGALLMNAQSTLDNATREGARAISLCGSDTSCIDAAVATVDQNLGILPFDPSVSPPNPRVITCRVAAAGTSAGAATCGMTPPTGTQVCPTGAAGVFTGYSRGDTIEVDVRYEYNYYLGGLLGAVKPTACVGSSARVVSQQSGP